MRGPTPCRLNLRDSTAHRSAHMHTAVPAESHSCCSLGAHCPLLAHADDKLQVQPSSAIIHLIKSFFQSEIGGTKKHSHFWSRFSASSAVCACDTSKCPPLPLSRSCHRCHQEGHAATQHVNSDSVAMSCMQICLALSRLFGNAKRLN